MAVCRNVVTSVRIIHALPLRCSPHSRAVFKLPAHQILDVLAFPATAS